MRSSSRARALLVAGLLAGGCASAGPDWSAVRSGGPDAGATVRWSRWSDATRSWEAVKAARSVAGLGYRGRAVAQLRGIVAEQPDALEAHRLLQELLVDSIGDWWVRRVYRDRLEARPDDADAIYLAARIEPDLRHQAELFERALDVDPAHPYARVGRALGIRGQGDISLALREAHTAAASAPGASLPWVFMGYLSLSRGEPDIAQRLFEEALARDDQDARIQMGIAAAAYDGGRQAKASAAALEAVRLAPGDVGVTAVAGRLLEEAAVPAHLRAAVAIARARSADVRVAGPLLLLEGRCLLALGDADAAESALVGAREDGASLGETAGLLRRARILAGRYREAVEGAIAELPSGVLAPDNRYAPRWRILLDAARSMRAGDAASLEALARAARQVGWERESRLLVERARQRAPADARLDALAADERAFRLFLEDLDALARRLQQLGRAQKSGPDLTELLGEVRRASLARLGRDVTAGVKVHSYPLLGEFASSVTSSGDFSTTFDERGLFLLIGTRIGEGAQIMLGRLVAVRADAHAVVRGEEVTYDECWIESDQLPRRLAGLRGGLAGLTLDRLVILQLESTRRTTHAPDPDIPFEVRPAFHRDDRRALDTPSAVARRIDAEMADDAQRTEAVLDTIRCHELGHVLDARRLLPILHHPLRGLWLGLTHGLSASAVEQTLESRAAVTALADSAQPRAALTALLSFLPDTEGGTPHAAAYLDVVREAVREIDVDPGAFPSLGRDQNLVQQMDRLTDEEIRELGRRLFDDF